LPISASIEREFGNLALLLAVLATMVTAGTYTGANRSFGMVLLGTTTVLAVAFASPVILARYDLRLGLSPESFAVVSIVAYLLFDAVLGVLIGGAWTAIHKAISE
jgi:hypothetical protein